MSKWVPLESETCIKGHGEKNVGVAKCRARRYAKQMRPGMTSTLRKKKEEIKNIHTMPKSQIDNRY